MSSPNAEFDRILAVAESAEKDGRFQDAEALCRQVLAVDPFHIPALLRLGVIAAKVGNGQAGLFYLSKVIQTEPSSYEAIKWLSVLLRNGMDVKRATELSTQAVKMCPEDAEAHNNLGLCWLALHSLAHAENSFRKAISLQATLAIAHHNLGLTLRHLGRYPEAADEFRTAIQCAPKVPISYVNLGQLLLSEGRSAEAQSCFNEAIQTASGVFAGLMQLATSFMQDDTHDEAEQCLRQAIQLQPSQAEPHALLGKILQQKGAFEEAEQELQKSLEIQPNHASACLDLVHCRRLTSQDTPLVQRMVELAQTQGLSAVNRRHLHYALGKAYDDLGNYEAAIRHFDEANKTTLDHLGRRPFDRDRNAKQLAGIRAMFPKEIFRDYFFIGSQSDLPILVVGMIRSGTTLVEQILSSHPAIASGGELRFLQEKAWGLFDRNRTICPPVGKILADEYLQILRSHGPNERRVTDKMPHNFTLLGIFHLLFPKGRIIHCRRHPVDNCLSIYTTPFREVISFAHNREDIVSFYLEYARLMEHWREVLPTSSFLEIDYESLVREQEPTVRKMIEFCGVPWDEACLHHDQNSRPVKTPSQWQARQPVYTSSVDRWRNYEPWLGPFKDLLPPTTSKSDL